MDSTYAKTQQLCYNRQGIDILITLANVIMYPTRPKPCQVDIQYVSATPTTALATTFSIAKGMARSKYLQEVYDQSKLLPHYRQDNTSNDNKPNISQVIQWLWVQRNSFPPGLTYDYSILPGDNRPGRITAGRHLLQDLSSRFRLWKGIWNLVNKVPERNINAPWEYKMTLYIYHPIRKQHPSIVNESKVRQSERITVQISYSSLPDLRNYCTSLMHIGVGQLITASDFPGSTATLPWLTKWPKYLTVSTANSHLLSLATNYLSRKRYNTWCIWSRCSYYVRLYTSISSR